MQSRCLWYSVAQFLRTIHQRPEWLAAAQKNIRVFQCQLHRAISAHRQACRPPGPRTIRPRLERPVNEADQIAQR